MSELKFVAVEKMDCAGAMVWWNLSGQVSYLDLVNRLLEVGVAQSMLPSPVGAIPALTRAMYRFQDQHRFLRPLPRTQRGWALVQEYVENGKTLRYEVKGTVRLQGKDQLEVEAPEEIKANLERAFLEERTHYTANDVSTWITGTLMPCLRAISLRPRGGVYFIPHTMVETFRRQVGALPGTFCEVPALRTEEAVKAILDALTREVAQEAETIMHEVTGDELGPRALRNRQSSCEELLGKLTEYEILLGTKLPDITAKVQELKAAVTAATLVAEAA